jgi:hypothetical protein
MRRPLPRPELDGSGLGLLLAFVVAGCGSNPTNTDAVGVPSDAAAEEPSADTTDTGASAPLEARPGLPSGSPCALSSQCLSGACTVGTCSEWPHAMLLRIDTTAAGAGLKEPVSDFPLLVRLDRSRFDFAEAQADGADLRFGDRDGRVLPHQIERWDAARGTAQIWVRIAHIAADTDDNTLLMFWGNPGAASTSSGPAVFDAYACVLHMSPEPNDVAWHLEDASEANAVASVQNGTTSEATAAGIAGVAMAFDGSTYLATSARTTAPVSVSFWLQTTTTAGAGLAAFSNKPSGTDAVVGQAVRMDERGRLTFSVLRANDLDRIGTLTSYHDGAWHLVVARLSDVGQYLFVDGEPVADGPGHPNATTTAGSWRFAQVPSSPSGDADAGTLPAQPFTGALDEVRVAPFAASDAWIKLAYATERPDAVAVSYARLP